MRKKTKNTQDRWPGFCKESLWKWTKKKKVRKQIVGTKTSSFALGVRTNREGKRVILRKQYQEILSQWSTSLCKTKRLWSLQGQSFITKDGNYTGHNEKTWWRQIWSQISNLLTKTRKERQIDGNESSWEGINKEWQRHWVFLEWERLKDRLEAVINIYRFRVFPK